MGANCTICIVATRSATNRRSDAVELKVFSTRAGAIPLMVRKNEAGCFIPYEQGVELLAEIAKLKREMRKMEQDHIDALEAKAQQSMTSGYDMGKQFGGLITDDKIGTVIGAVKNLTEVTQELLEFVAQQKSANAQQ